MQQDLNTRRIEAFSDGIFSIAITLLVLEIKVPSADMVQRHGLALSLIYIWPSYLAYIISFATILVIWAHHHWVYSAIKKSDLKLIYWNGLLLLFVTFVPFPTGLLAEYLLHSEAKVATSLYTGTFLAISLSFHGLWRHASANEKLLGSETKNATRITYHYRLAPIFYFASFISSFYSEATGIALCLLSALYFAVGGWPRS
ncbi:TMEM175 family protein [Methylocystis heyeri]|uniref:DUF1211 domain-containing protein n=1 Tax=Methylocystis heyeri TaxID=391905 RepID=A0A6B8KBY0_9HYPH|nr:TMEM175 family protein [Methylocystis heyeri]QGM44561.1 DUF1211 domain-containing protein [Methylocystis heyeri]